MPLIIINVRILELNEPSTNKKSNLFFKSLPG